VLQFLGRDTDSMKRLRYKPEILGTAGILLAAVLLAFGIRLLCDAWIHASVVAENGIRLRNNELARNKDLSSKSGALRSVDSETRNRAANQYSERRRMATSGTRDHRFAKVQAAVCGVLFIVFGIAQFVRSLFLLMSGPYQIVQPYQKWHTHGFFARRLHRAAAKWQT
jgi:hypothetical protein